MRQAKNWIWLAVASSVIVRCSRWSGSGRRHGDAICRGAEQVGSRQVNAPGRELDSGWLSRVRSWSVVRGDRTIAEVGACRKSCANIWTRIYATVKYDHADTAGGSLLDVSS